MRQIGETKSVAVGHLHVQKNDIEGIGVRLLHAQLQGGRHLGPVAGPFEMLDQHLGQHHIVVNYQNIRHNKHK